MLVLVLVFGCAGLLACGSSEKEAETTPASTGTPATSEKETPAPSEKETPATSGGGFTWDDMPVYPGADANESMWVTATKEGKKVETRIYQTEDSVEKVTDFYKSEMPDNGWHEQMWMSLGGGVTGAYTKNNEQDFATIAIADVGEEGTFITLTRGQE